MQTSPEELALGFPGFFHIIYIVNVFFFIYLYICFFYFFFVLHFIYLFYFILIKRNLVFI
jgi:hypothetical protein